MTETIKPISIFISYSWDSEDHQDWVGSLADKLEEVQEVHVTLDQYDLDSYSDKNHFMEKGVFESDVILVIVTEEYVEKANTRVGGAGIETKMASALHWAESEKSGSSRVITILREGQEAPRYLKDKFYVDFREPEDFEKSLKKLFGHLNGKSKRPRPNKKYSINEIPREKQLSRVEDFLKINHKKRHLVFEKKDTTDFSGGSKIKFELWKTESPAVDYFLFLFDNITLTATIERLSRLLKEQNIRLPRLTILRPEIKKKDYLEKLFRKNSLSISIKELTYPNYVWDFCIDDDAKRKEDIYQIPFFIDQPLVEFCEDQTTVLGPAFKYIKSALYKTEQSSAKIIIAPGGTGKTTLCHRIAKLYSESGNQVSVLIQAEMLKSEDWSGLRNSVKIDSVFDLYEVYAKTSGRERDDGYIFDRVTFETAILSGKLVLIIDGIDEFISLFPETFNLSLFLESVESLNRELCSSKIIITTRSDVFDDDLMQKCDQLDKYTLLGFDENACRNYMEQRFSKYSNPQEIADKAFIHIGPIIEKDENNRILPFVVDLLSNIAEETVGGDKRAFDLSLDGVDYLCQDGTTDYLVASVLRRESVRQSIEASIDEVMEIFWELAVLFGEKFPLSELEELVKIMCPADSQKVLRNPLLVIGQGGFCRFKYDFLSDYFKTLYIINTLSLGTASSMFLKLISRYPYGDSVVFKEVSQYFKKKPNSLIPGSKKIIQSITKVIESPTVFKPNSESYRAIGFLIRLISELPESQASKQTFTKNILDAFNVSEGNLSYVAIFGDCIPINFEELNVSHSMFVSYKSFTRSRFTNTTFNNCYFDKTYGEIISDSFIPNMFTNCRMGDLDGAIVAKADNLARNKALTEKELRKYFSAFYHGGRFVDKKKAFFKYSNSVRGVSPKLDDQLLRKKVLEVKSRKADHSYFQIAEGYQDSVYSFITNNRIDSNISEIIDLID